MIHVSGQVNFPQISMESFYASFRNQRYNIQKNPDSTFYISTCYKVFSTEDKYNTGNFLFDVHVDYKFTLDEINSAGIFQLLYSKLKETLLSGNPNLIITDI
jgi:hypothetical protein